MVTKTEELIGEFASIIRAETEGGYLEYWHTYRNLLTEEQQSNYFTTLGGLCAGVCKEAGMMFVGWYGTEMEEIEDE